jgi:hypothetical protein
MNQEIKQKLLTCYNQDKLILFELTFNTNYLFYEEPENFNDYLELVNDLKESTLLNIINNFNQ